MAKRPVFFPSDQEKGWVEHLSIDFEWYPGFSLSQKQASIDSLHHGVRKYNPGLDRILEVSTKSRHELGRRLSAFNLKTIHPLKDNVKVDLESVFQGSKVFGEARGPYHHLYDFPARDAKRYMKENGLNVGRVREFQLADEVWPNKPKTAFYNFLYLSAAKAFFEWAYSLEGDSSLEEELLGYQAFTDIEFNPDKSLNCQAESCALYVALSKAEELSNALVDRESFIAMTQRSDGVADERGQLSFLPAGEKA